MMDSWISLQQTFNINLLTTQWLLSHAHESQCLVIHTILSTSWNAIPHYRQQWPLWVINLICPQWYQRLLPRNQLPIYTCHPSTLSQTEMENLGAIQVLRNTFFLGIWLHPRNANNVEPHTSVTLSSRKADTHPPPTALCNTWMVTIIHTRVYNHRSRQVLIPSLLGMTIFQISYFLVPRYQIKIVTIINTQGN